MITVLYWYIVGAYLIGLALFLYEVARSIVHGDYKLLGFGAILLLLAPLTTWHGVLHYMAVGWHRLNGTPFKPWI